MQCGLRCVSLGNTRVDGQDANLQLRQRIDEGALLIHIWTLETLSIQDNESYGKSEFPAVLCMLTAVGMLKSGLVPSCASKLRTCTLHISAFNK